MSNRNTWLLLDSNFLCYRVRYTMKDMSFREIPTSIAYGFLQTILILQNTFKTKNIAFCFDSKHNKRKKIYPQYKASRKHNQPLTTEQEEEENIFRQQVVKLRRTYLPYIGFNNVFMQSGYESDDIMAKVCYSRLEHLDFIMVTADHDMFQCLRPNVRMFNPVKRKMWTVSRFKNEFGIMPRQWIDVKTLAGCTSDNIGGLKGIGEKTALRFLKRELKPSLKTYKTIMDYFANPKEEESVLSKLVTLPYPGTKPVTLKRDCVTNKKWNSLCRKLGIKSLKLARE